jgi:oligopeptidase B
MDAHFHQQDYHWTEVLFMRLHIRGGEDLGRKWYEDGKLLKKKILSQTLLIVLNI